MSVKNRHNYYLASIISITLLAPGWIIVTSSADDASGGLDMNALASIASSLGSNPQIMSMVSGLFNQNSAKSSPSNAANSFDSSTAAGSSASLDQDPNQVIGADTTAVTPQVQTRQVQVQQTKASPASSSGGSSLSSLLSLLPNVMPSLTQGAQKAPSIAQVAPATPVAAVAQPVLETQVPIASPPIAPVAPAAGANPAQAVINQVLTAYASGQIPPEMIQLGLSGRVPPQIMELALSGQVPPQIIQMVITGQIPMSTINAFLASMQPSPRSAPSTAATGEASASSGATASSGVGGIISTTRALVEALFKPSANGGRKIMVPTLLGPLPIQIPTIPSVRQFGKMVGSSITNMASMVPF